MQVTLNFTFFNENARERRKVAELTSCAPYELRQKPDWAQHMIVVWKSFAVTILQEKNAHVQVTLVGCTNGLHMVT